MKQKSCISTQDIILWTAAFYAAYSLVLYVYRKPACEYAAKLCTKLN